MDGFFADDPTHHAVPTQDADALTDQHLAVPATDGLEVAEPLVVDVRNHQADFVDVPRQQDTWLAAINGCV